MKPSDVKAIYKSYYRFHKETGMSWNSLRNWEKWGYIPIKSQYILQDKTEGKLIANWKDASCEN